MVLFLFIEGMISPMGPDAVPNYGHQSEEEDESIGEISPTSENTVTVDRDSVPFNEFKDNPRLFYSSFPFLFLFGRGLLSPGTVNEEAVRHMMLQFSNRFANCHCLIFLLFDQMQRHAATRVVASRVKCNPQSFEDFVKWINEPDFTEKLKTAAKNPTSPSSIALLKKLGPNIQSCTSRIPFSSSQRAASIRNLVAMRYFFGMPA